MGRLSTQGFAGIWGMVRGSRWVPAILGAALVFALPSVAQTNEFPDLIVNEARLNDFDFRNTIIPGRVHIRLSNSTPNIGLGPLELFPGNVTGEGQQVFQRVQISGGGFFDRFAGSFVFHVAHNHFHFEDWAKFSIREVLPGDGVGKILAGGRKTSFCLLDSTRYFGQTPAGPVPLVPQFVLCGDAQQGISVGWEDIYFKELPDQWIDITNLGPGTYWLESEVDPSNRIQEMDETNNVGRIKITILPGDLPPIVPVPLHPRLWIVASVMLGALGAVALRRRPGMRRP